MNDYNELKRQVVEYVHQTYGQSVADKLLIAKTITLYMDIAHQMGRVEQADKMNKKIQ